MVRVSRLGGVVGVLALTSLIAACSGATGGTPEPSPSSPSSTGPAVPKIEAPLPASLIQGDPCAALTSAQVDGLFTNTPTRDQAAKDTGAAKSCGWHDIDRGSLIGIQFVYAWKHGLADVYATQGRGFFKVLAPVQGYPVVAYGPTDDRSSGACGVAVGIADNAAFEADVQFANSAVGKGDPCDDARKVADLAITTLKASA
ncbi:DUF3558 domain-containing protein [Amycolatopsis carbonis]|uniref:DUF3558 domain-containing protein n=1 Tax=Amycolatopsis carbonis TaxID=715471 RepID=A0A9Y2IMY1_9PSEU|nr:DUF3558 domain-containing protein [Amycolatopsis sp. 2-15]WIX83300.1 DUF3558 domain-containing protein [Amycolatopsis sp. 2-15]